MNIIKSASLDETIDFYRERVANAHSFSNQFSTLLQSRISRFPQLHKICSNLITKEPKVNLDILLGKDVKLSTVNWTNLLKKSMEQDVGHLNDAENGLIEKLGRDISIYIKSKNSINSDPEIIKILEKVKELEMPFRNIDEDIDRENINAFQQTINSPERNGQMAYNICMSPLSISLVGAGHVPQIMRRLPTENRENTLILIPIDQNHVSYSKIDEIPDKMTVLDCSDEESKANSLENLERILSSCGLANNTTNLKSGESNKLNDGR